MEQARTLDTEQINELRQLDAGKGAVLTRLVDRFAATIDERIANILRCIEENRLDDLKIAAHSLKGAAGNLGAERLSELNARIEEAATSNDVAAAKLLIATLAEESESARVALLRETGRAP